MRYYVIQKKKTEKYYQHGGDKLPEIFGKAFKSAYVFNALTSPPKQMLNGGERAVEVEQVWRRKR